ncbi:unannotated protein [freshwater metagenome]|uniref:Unannotated protein n=1 Tax=freshwater metagenome TaxID=449393 RepID=A0A6J7IYV6_9ZZZZ
MATPPPSTPDTAPAVVVSALAGTSCGRSQVCGSPADNAESTNRLTENTASPAR